MELRAGQRVLSLDGGWKRATVTAVLPDGTAVVEHDLKSMSVLPRWYGATHADLQQDDVRATDVGVALTCRTRSRAR